MCQVTDELLEKTIGEMSGIEFIQLIKAANEDIIDDKQEDEEDKYVYASLSSQRGIIMLNLTL